MKKVIRISHPDMTIEYIDYDPDRFSDVIDHAMDLMEQRFPELAEVGELYFDGDRIYGEDAAEAKWFETEEIEAAPAP